MQVSIPVRPYPSDFAFTDKPNTYSWDRIVIHYNGDAVDKVSGELFQCSIQTGFSPVGILDAGRTIIRVIASEASNLAGDTSNLDGKSAVFLPG